jgi:carboxyl-terminal processing protease
VFNKEGKLLEAQRLESRTRYDVEMLKELDPHSVYISKDEVKKMNEPLEGSFEGIGISFNILNDTLFVITPISGGPSEKVGIQAGDKIIKVDGENIAGVGLTNEDVFRLLRGEKGTNVTVSILRRNVNKLLDFTIKRDKIPIFSVDATYRIDNNTGYIKINRFSQTTHDEFKKAANELKGLGAENLILDLGGNVGGLLDQAIFVADEFLSKDKLIVYTQGANSRRRESYSTSRGAYTSGNVVVLIDEGSASASEIVAGAIQDWDRGIIIGRRSFGKGLVQRPFTLPDSSQVRLTIARYYTPSGRSIQKPYSNKADYDREIVNRYYTGEMVTKDSIILPDSLKMFTKVNNRPVYGGGGIMPDIFVPMDTLHYSDYYRDLIRKGILNTYVLNYVDQNRKKIKKQYPTPETFKNDYQIDKALLTSLFDYAGEQGLPYDSAQVVRSEEHLTYLLKAYMARDIWTTSDYYEIINEMNPAYRRAVKVMQHWSEYEIKVLNQ